MSKALIEYLINIIVFVPVILILIVISLKMSRKNMDRINISSYAQVIERINLSKEISLYVVKIGAGGCVLICSPHNTEVIKELSEDEVNEILKNKKANRNEIDLSKIVKFDIKAILNKGFTKEKEYGHTK